MNTRIVLGDNIWFVVNESVEEIINIFNSKGSILKATVVDGYEVAIVKDRVICFVEANVEGTTEIDLGSLQV
jgi:hypothetical protein